MQQPSAEVQKMITDLLWHKLEVIDPAIEKLATKLELIPRLASKDLSPAQFKTFMDQLNQQQFFYSQNFQKREDLRTQASAIIEECKSGRAGAEGDQKMCNSLHTIFEEWKGDNTFVQIRNLLFERMQILRGKDAGLNRSYLETDIDKNPLYAKQFGQNTIDAILGVAENEEGKYDDENEEFHDAVEPTHTLPPLPQIQKQQQPPPPQPLGGGDNSELRYNQLRSEFSEDRIREYNQQATDLIRRVETADDREALESVRLNWQSLVSRQQNSFRNAESEITTLCGASPALCNRPGVQDDTANFRNFIAKLNSDNRKFSDAVFQKTRGWRKPPADLPSTKPGAFSRVGSAIGDVVSAAAGAVSSASASFRDYRQRSRAEEKEQERLNARKEAYDKNNPGRRQRVLGGPNGKELRVWNEQDVYTPGPSYAEDESAPIDCESLGRSNILTFDNRFVRNYASGAGLSNDKFLSLRAANGDLPFASMIEYSQFVARVVPVADYYWDASEPDTSPKTAPERMYSIEYDATANRHVQRVKTRSVVKLAQKIEFVDENAYAGTFWDVPVSPRVDLADMQRRGDWLGILRDTLADRYGAPICGGRPGSAERIGTFLMHWMGNETLPAAAERLFAAVPVLPQDAADLRPFVLINHALNVLDRCIGERTFHPLIRSGMFQPFIRGFIDDPEAWNMSQLQLKDSLSRRFYMTLPEAGRDDAMSSMLRAHPNTYLVRLSPSAPFHLDFIMYRVRDDEKTSDRKARRKFSSFVVFFRRCLLSTTLVKRCPTSYLHLLQAMNNAYLQTDTSYAPLDMLLLIDRLIFETAKEKKDTLYSRPIMASYGSALRYYMTLCSDPSNPSTVGDHSPPDYAVLLTTIRDQKPAFDQLFAALFNPRKDEDDGSKRITPVDYAAYLEHEAFCATLKPSMDNFGDPGCSVSLNWMKEEVPFNPHNALMADIYSWVENYFYSDSLWECEKSLSGGVREVGSEVYAATLGSNRDIYVAGETSLRKQHVWHLMRWLGMRYFKAAFATQPRFSSGSNQPARPDPEQSDVAWVVIVTKILKWVLNSASAYPFASAEMADNMLAALGKAGVKAGMVLRLSASTPLAFERRRPNPEFKGDTETSYMDPFIVDTIRSDTWVNWVSEGLTSWQRFSRSLQKFAVTDNKIRKDVLEYLFRRELFRTTGLVLVRNLPSIRQYLESCNVNVDLRSRLPDSVIKSVFSNVSTASDLERLDYLVDTRGAVYPNDETLWRQIRSVTESVNALGEESVTASSGELCRPGTFGFIDFSANTIGCAREADWILSQPLLTSQSVEKLKSGEVRTLTQNTLKLLNSFDGAWCSRGMRGDRNRSIVVNWFGIDGMREYVALKAGRSSVVLGPAKEAALAARLISELVSDRGFALFASPPEQRLFAIKYPGFLVVSLSHVKQRNLSVVFLPATDFNNLVETEISMIALQPYVHPDIPLALTIRLVLYMMYRAHIAPLDEVKVIDAKDCAEQPVQSTGVTDLKERSVFKQNVPNEYASMMLFMLLADSGAGGPDALPKVSSADKRADQVAPWFMKLVQAGRMINSGFEAFKRLPTTVRNGSQYLNDVATVYMNAENFWYDANVVDASLLNRDLQPLIEGFLSAQEADIKQNHVATQVPSLLRRVGEDDRSGFAGEVATYRLKEFRGGVIKTEKEERSFFKDLKKALFSGRGASATERVPQDTILEAASRAAQVNPSTGGAMLLEKVRRGEPLGPGELKLGMYLGVVGPDGQPLQRPVPTQFMARTMPAGPATEDASGPFFQDPKAEYWASFKDGYPGRDSEQYFREVSEMELDSERGRCDKNAPDYVFPSFDVDANGQILARCGRTGWMNAPIPSASQYEKMDNENKQLVIAILTIAKHWAPSAAHQIRLWRWLGLGCIGKTALQIIEHEALMQLTDPTPASATPVQKLAAESRREQREMIAEFSRTEMKRSSEDRRTEVCKRRVLFLMQMISSNFLFPYVPDDKTARQLANYNPERVVVMLSWSKSGQFMGLLQSRSGKLMRHEYQAEDVVMYMQWVPTTVRLRIFNDFSGGIVADNYDFFVRVMKDAAVNAPLGAADMRRYAVRAALSRPDQGKLDTLWAQYKSTGTQTPQQIREMSELQNVSLLLQARNLTAQDLFLYEEIRKLEARPGNDKTVAELADKLYRARHTDVRKSEAEDFENLALCQRPEFVPYIRRKLKEKYPDLDPKAVDAMDRDQLCRLLLNNPALESLYLPVKLWQLRDVPQDMRDDYGLLDVWNPYKKPIISEWLMRNYGVTVEQMQADNQADSSAEVRQQQGLLLQRQFETEKTSLKSLMEDVDNFREFLTLGAKCPFSGIDNKSNLCAKLMYEVADGQKKALADGDRTVRVPDLFAMIFSVLCNVNIPLLPNDYEFIFQSFGAMRDYLILCEYTDIKVVAERNLAKQCVKIKEMFRKLMADLKTTDSIAWKEKELSNIFEDQTLAKYYKSIDAGVRKGYPLKAAWSSFRANKHIKQEKLTFVFAVLLFTAHTNGIVALPSVPIATQ